MGQFEATFPMDRLYTTNHMWAQPSAAGRYRFGLTSYAVRLLQDVYFLDFIVEPEMTLARRQQVGSIESKKAESDLFAPTTGTLFDINRTALDDPSIINVEIYEGGWLLEILPDSMVDLLEPDDYLQHLEQAWEVAQRTIKGQI
ncbi:MAG: glycine cleavage system protein H [Planctomycetaceae bacterium]